MAAAVRVAAGAVVVAVRGWAVAGMAAAAAEASIRQVA